MHNAITHAATIACGHCGREKPGDDFPALRRLGNRPLKCWVCRYLAARTPRGRQSALPHSPFGQRPTRLDPAQPPVTRVCRKCGIEKPFAEFYLDRARGRRQTPCGACGRAYRRQFYAANRDRLRAVQKRYAQDREDPARRRARNARIARAQRVKNAIRGRTQRLRILGLLSLADHCEDCGGPAALVHHETYDDVCALVSLCRACHMARHYRHWREHGGGPVRYPWEYDQSTAPSAGASRLLGSSSLSSSSSSSNLRAGEAHRLDNDDEHEKTGTGASTITGGHTRTTNLEL